MKIDPFKYSRECFHIKTLTKYKLFEITVYTNIYGFIYITCMHNISSI